MSARRPIHRHHEVPLADVCSPAGPLLLADLHDALEPGAELRLSAAAGSAASAGADAAARLADLLEGAGFSQATITHRSDRFVARAVRARSLADIVGPAMRLLVCGLNPSLHAADAGVGYAGPSNRFWSAAADVLGATPLDARALLVHHGLGMTDLVKRATASASGLTAGEYRAGLARVKRLVAWLAPGAVCFVGLAGWRAAVDRGAPVGAQPNLLGTRPVYVMPSTSGRNAHATRAGLAEHLRAALALAAAADA